DQRLPQALDGVEVVVVGVVEQMPQAFERGLSFRFRLESCVGPEEPCPQPALIRVSWHNATLFGKVSQPLPHIEPGQRWQLNLRLRRPHASVNPGLFDAELRALQERLAAVAYVRKARPGYPNVQMPSGLAGPMHQVERLRLLLREKMHAVLAGASKEASSVLVALVIGDQAAISASWWELFNRTGIGHLMSISGLHITMLAALAGGLARRIWRCERLAQWMYPRALPSLMPEPRARWLFGVTAAFGYSLLAGWGIPAQRTCWMLAVAGLAFSTGRARSAPAVICTAAAVVCLMDPWAPMAAGFWLSFAAVAAIIWHGSRSLAASAETSGALQPASGPHHLQDPSRRSLALIESVARAWRVKLAALLRAAARTQLAATVVLLPLGVLFFATVSLASPIANAIAIPLVSALITPLAMAGATLALGNDWLGGLVLSGAAILTDALLAALAWLDRGGGAAITVGLPSTATLLLAALACFCLLVPIPLRGKSVCSLGLLPLLLGPPPSLDPNALVLTALDIGQGTAVLIETAGRRLLYDTGPAFSGEANA
ncbi:MAG: ComEC/Rec2 family competence protein, partial [Quisquiliibacterium sp.]